MRYLVLCCDYDGTLATHGRLLPETVEALERLIASGRRLVMVTGRELDDLQSVCERLDLFEYVVAENGALLYHPATRAEKTLAPAPTRRFRRAPARAGRRARLARARDRRDLGAVGEHRSRHHPRARPRAAGDLQQGRGDGAARRREQGDRPGVRARARSGSRLTTPSPLAMRRTITHCCARASSR